jgi:hypothetical protein
MKDINGNLITKGEKVNVIIAGEFYCQAIFKWCIGGFVTLQEDIKCKIDQIPLYNVYKVI